MLATHEAAAKWQVLLLGNGLSTNVWPAFAYGSLFDHAGGGGLTAADLALFDSTPNFERVLADLNTAIRVAQVELPNQVASHLHPPQPRSGPDGTRQQ